MKRPDIAHWIMAMIILILGLFLWLTPYQFKKWGPDIVRIHRLTGKADMLDIEGWYPMRPKTIEELIKAQAIKDKATRKRSRDFEKRLKALGLRSKRSPEMDKAIEDLGLEWPSP